MEKMKPKFIRLCLIGEMWKTVDIQNRRKIVRSSYRMSAALTGSQQATEFSDEKVNGEGMRQTISSAHDLI